MAQGGGPSERHGLDDTRTDSPQVGRVKDSKAELKLGKVGDDMSVLKPFFQSLIILLEAFIV
jgi:hypothetical protein